MTAFQCALGWSLPLSKGTKFVASLPPPLPLCRTQSGGTVAAHTSHSMFATSKFREVGDESAILNKLEREKDKEDTKLRTPQKLGSNLE